MTSSVVHLSDLHFGALADRALIEAALDLVPDLEPNAIVLTGDLTQRARHGEFQAVRLLVGELERTAPVMAVPGNHDVQWWLRPLAPFGGSAKYRKWIEYFGPVLTPTLALPDAVLAGALSAHGLAWGSLTRHLRDLAVKGHLPKSEAVRVKSVFERADQRLLRMMVLHHNVLPGAASERMGLARWARAQQRIVETGADVVLCGHDHEERADLLDKTIVVSCAGTLSLRTPEGHPGAFSRVCWDETSVQVELYRWDSDRRGFRRSDVHAFERPRRAHETAVAAGVG